MTDDATPANAPDGPDAADSTVGAPRLVVMHGGEPTEEEIAALVVALPASPPPADEHPPTPSEWTNRRSMLRRALDHGPGRWTASARPRS